MTPAERKQAMPHGGQRRAAKRISRSESYITLVMNDLVVPKTRRGIRTLLRARVAIAQEMGKPVEDVFSSTPPTPASSGALQRAS